MKTNLKRRISDVDEDDFQRAIGTNELNFSNDRPTPTFNDLDIETEKRNLSFDFRNPNQDATENDSLEQDITDDDLSPETLIHEDGALSSYDRGDDEPFDQSFTIVGEREIGGGSGLDEAELALKDPLDGKPWNGKETQN